MPNKFKWSFSSHFQLFIAVSMPQVQVQYLSHCLGNSKAIQIKTERNFLGRNNDSSTIVSTTKVVIPTVCQFLLLIHFFVSKVTMNKSGFILYNNYLEYVKYEWKR